MRTTITLSQHTPISPFRPWSNIKKIMLWKRYKTPHTNKTNRTRTLHFWGYSIYPRDPILCVSEVIRHPFLILWQGDWIPRAIYVIYYYQFLQFRGCHVSIPLPLTPLGLGGLPLHVRFLLPARAHPFRRGNGKGDIFFRSFSRILKGRWWFPNVP